MIKNKLVLLLKSSSPLNYPLITPLVSFISLCAFIQAGLILSFGTLTLKDIDQMSIMKSTIFSTPKRGVITGQRDSNMLAYRGSRTLLDSYIGSIG